VTQTLSPQETIGYSLDERSALMYGDVRDYNELIKAIVVPTGPTQDFSIDNDWGQSVFGAL